MAAPTTIRPSECLNDDCFGPAVVGCRDDFDFTKLFEQSMLSIAPSSAFVIFAVLRLVYLYRRPVILNGGWSFQKLKFAAIGCYLSLQIALLVLACTITPSYERTTIPAATLSLVAATLVLVVSVFEHSRTLKPSALLNVYLFFTFLFDVAQSRTQWLSSRQSPHTKVFTASIGVKLTVLLIEAQSKTRWIKGPESHHRNPEATSNIFNQSVFFWLNDLLLRGYHKPLSAGDLYILDKSLLAENYQDVFWDEFERRRVNSNAKGKGRALLFSVITILKRPLLIPILPRLAVTAFSFTQPFFINAVLKYLKEVPSKTSANVGYGFIGAAAVIYTGLAISTGLYWYFHQRALIRLRACLVTAIYRKTIHKNAKEDGNSSAITLMNSDVGRIQGGIRDLHECWASIIETALASWLLQRQIGVAFIAPILVIFACTGLTLIVARFAGKRQGQWMSLLQRRVAFTSAIIPSLPAIKMSGLSYQIGRLVQICRESEITGAKRFRIITTVSTIIAFAPLLLSPVVTFAFSADNLNIETAFTALSWINLLCQPLTQVFQSVPQLLAALTCFNRVQAFLESGSHGDGQSPAEEMETTKRTSNSDATMDDDVRATPGSDKTIKLTVQNGKFGWEGDSWALENIELSIRPSSFTMITGGMAAGKSTLCKALLQEVPFSEGSVHWHDHTAQMAYCDQDPFLFNSTIRENIVGFGSYNAPWYEEVVRYCHLSTDLESLPRKDQTVVGSKGLALSGGQRKRICLARALYSRPDVAILDDVLSGMDSHTENLIIRDIFGPDGLFRKIGTTVFLSTQPTRHFRLADWIIILRDKEILHQSSVTNLDLSKDVALSELLLDTANTPKQSLSQEEGAETSFSAALKSEENEPDAETNRSTSDLANYKFYFVAIGVTMLLPFLAAGIGFAFLYNFSTVWLEFWQNSKYGLERLSFYLGIYFMLQIVCLTLLAAFFGYNGNVMGPRASSKLHLRALCILLRAPLEYYTTVDAGVPTGYFSQDMSIVDNDLNNSLGNTVLTGLTAVGQAALIGIASPYVLIGYPVILFVLFFVQKCYLKTSTQLRVLMLEAKEPLYKHFMETIDGLATIRAFGWVSANIDLNAKLLDESQRSSYLLPMLQQWLNMVLNLCVAAIAILFVALATQLRTSAGFTGVGLVSLMSFGELMGNLVRCYSELQTATVALSRLRTLEHGVPREGSDRNASAPPDRQWPSAGDIKLDRVSASYRTDISFPGKKKARGSNASSVNILRNISMSAASGERVLVCGRTGSGKSSLLLLLQGFLKPTSGDVLLDNVDTCAVACPTLRNRIIALPQVPFFLRERCSVRDNLEYHGKDSEIDFDTYKHGESQAQQDEECEYALQAVGLWELVKSRGGLDAELNDDALSRGQKQLFSLARAIVRVKLRQRSDSSFEKTPGGVLLLDEFNSGLDMKTERSMWSVIQREFPLYTIICVAHRLEGALDCNKVIVMSEGEIVEVGKPRDLLSNERGKFRSLWQADSVHERHEYSQSVEVTKEQ